MAAHLSDTFVIEKLASAMQLLDEDEDKDSVTVEDVDESKEESTKGATHYTLHLNGNNIQVTWRSATEEHLLTCNVEVASFIWYQYMSTDNNITTIDCCTEIMHNQLLMRCHPSYQGEGPWFDWVSVHFEAWTFNGKTFPEGNYPCKVLAILSKQQNTFLEETEIVVQSSLAHTGKGSVLFEEWELMDGYHVVSLSSIMDSLFVLELGRNKISVALSYSEWPSCFTEMSY